MTRTLLPLGALLAACGGPSTEVLLGDPGPAVSMRVVHGNSAAPDVDLCVVRDSGTDGPLLSGAIGYRAGTARLEVAEGAQAFLLVEGGDCDAIVAQVTAPDEAGTWTLFLGEEDWETPYDTTGATWIQDSWPSELESGRFYARFFNGALDVDGASVKQFGCNTPFAAFENTASGALGFAPNNQAATFSASVDTGSDAFVADLFYCENTAVVLFELAQHRFGGGELQTHYLIGDGGDQAFGVTSCLETSPGEPCTTL